MLRRKKGLQIFLLTALLILGPFSFVAQANTHTVMPGETIFLIAQRYGVSYQALSQINNLANPDIIYPGNKINLPEPYTVKEGDTLWKLAQARRTNLNILLMLNNLANPNQLFPGQKILLPPAFAAGSSSTAMASRGGRNYAFSPSEIDLFARLVHSEAAGEPYIGQVAVAATVLNRINSPRYPNTLTGVIYQVSNGFYQYSPVLDGRINLPANQSAYNAVRDALQGWDPSLGATGFYNASKTTNQWVRQQPVTTVIGNHIFFR